MQNAKTKFIALLFTAYIIATFGLLIWAIQHSPSRAINTDTVFGSAPDFSAITNIAERKTAFFNYFTPIIEHKNTLILADRERLAAVQNDWQQNAKLSHTHQLYLSRWLKRYKIKEEWPIEKQLAELDKRMHIIPPALVLAQAANESAWGTSRFAQDGNNYFGQWCFKKGCGLVPSGRRANAKHEVRKFKNPAGSVDAYLRNLNTHRAYKQLRNIRAQLHQNNQPITGVALAEGLIKYSERGEEYVHELQAMIRSNGLEK